MKPTFIRTKEITPYITKDNSSISEILHPSFIDGLQFSLAEATVEEGESTTPHFHTKSDEAYYFLSGRGIMHIGDETFSVQVGDTCLIPTMSRHWIKAEEGKLRILCICCPPYTHEQTTLEE